MKGLYSVLFFLMCFTISAQLADDFSDPDLSNRWSGDLVNFKVNDFEELQLQAPGGGTSYIASPVAFPDSISWNIYVRMEFDPSNTNRLRLWLLSDTEQLDAGNGYYLEIGETGSQDAIRFFYKNGSTRTQLAAGKSGGVATANAIARIRIDYTTNKEWVMMVDYTGGFLPEEEFRLQRNIEFPLPQQYFFGFWCTYTETRKNLFFFDDVIIEEPSEDLIPPTVTNFALDGNNKVTIFFNEQIDEASVVNAQNYSLNPHINLQQSSLVSPTQILLEYASPFQSQTTYQLNLKGITDLAGNVISDTSFTFDYFEVLPVARFDIVFNELMVRPGPSRGLPEQEYIELYNLSDKVIDLADLQIRDGNSVRLLPPQIVLPGEYVILCSNANVNLFAPFGKVAGMAFFPSLTDAGKLLILENRSSVYIHHVHYTDQWYRDNVKSRGGFSLELINPDAICQLSENWRGSDAGLGGTPGMPNSILARQMDNKQARIISAYVTDPLNLQITFDKLLDPTSIQNNTFATFSPSVLVVETSVSSPNLNVLNITFDEELPSGVVLEMTVQSVVQDCKGVPVMISVRPEFGLPELPAAGDLIINEVLYLPDVGGSRFVELINVSNKIIDLKDIFLANATGNTPEGFRMNALFQLLPGKIVALSEATEYIIERYQPPAHASIIYGRIPTLPDKSGNLQVYTSILAEKVILDDLNYTDDFHFGLLSNKRGTSIERIDPLGPTSNKSNWHSAATSVRNATPGYINSQFRQQMPDADQFLSIPDPFFSPDGDGNRDLLLIQYDLPTGGFRARVVVYDSDGRQIRVLANGEIVAASGNFKWDGTSDSGTKSRMGIYIILAELTGADGTVLRMKKDVVLGGVFD